MRRLFAGLAAGAMLLLTAKEEVGGPGSMKPEHACDGKGIDYLDACPAG